MCTKNKNKTKFSWVLQFYRKCDDKHHTFWQISHLLCHIVKQHSLGILETVVFRKRHFNNSGVILVPKQSASHLPYRSRTKLCTVVRYSSTPLNNYVHSHKSFGYFCFLSVRHYVTSLLKHQQIPCIVPTTAYYHARISAFEAALYTCTLTSPSIIEV